MNEIFLVVDYFKATGKQENRDSSPSRWRHDPWWMDTFSISGPNFENLEGSRIVIYERCDEETIPCVYTDLI